MKIIVSTLILGVFIAMFFGIYGYSKTHHSWFDHTQYTFVIPIRNSKTPLTLNLVTKFADIKAGECLVQPKPCLIGKKREHSKWTVDECIPDSFDYSYKIIDTDPNTFDALTTYWYGMGSDTLINYSQNQQSFSTEEKFGFGSSLSGRENYYSADCSLVKTYSAQSRSDYNAFQSKLQENIDSKTKDPKTPVKEVVSTKPTQSLPKFKKNQCVVSENVNCPPSNELESWEQACHPYQEVYRVENVGKLNYQISYWFGYQSNSEDLLGFKETVSFKYLDDRYFTLGDCSKLKKKYPIGNYSAIYQRNHMKLTATAKK